MPREFSPAPGVRSLSLGGRSLLYVEAQQQLFELNETALAVWRTLEAGGSARAAGDALTALGAPPGEAARMAAEAAAQWVCAGCHPRGLAGRRA